MKYQAKKFTVAVGSNEYRAGWDVIFTCRECGQRYTAHRNELCRALNSVPRIYIAGSQGYTHPDGTMSCTT